METEKCAEIEKKNSSTPSQIVQSFLNDMVRAEIQVIDAALRGIEHALVSSWHVDEVIARQVRFSQCTVESYSRLVRESASSPRQCLPKSISSSRRFDCERTESSIESRFLMSALLPGRVGHHVLVFVVYPAQSSETSSRCFVPRYRAVANRTRSGRLSYPTIQSTRTTS